MAEKEIAFSVKVNADGSKKTLNDLEKDFEKLSEQIKDVAVDSKEFDQLSKQLAQVGREVKNAELAFESLDTDQVAGELGSVAGAVGDVSAAFVLLGDESGAIEEVAKNIETALGVSMAFKGAIEGISSARKLLNNSTLVSNTLEKINTFVKGENAAASAAAATAETARGTATAGATVATSGATAGLKLFRIALISTGIGAIVVGLGLLIANFDKVKEVVTSLPERLQKLSNSFKEMEGWVKVLIGIMTFGLVPMFQLYMDLLQEFGIIESEEMRESAKRRAAEVDMINRQTKQKIDLINQEIEAEKKKGKTVGDMLDFEIEKKKAAGEDYAELEKQKILLMIRTTEKQAELAEESIRIEAEAFIAKQKILAQGSDALAGLAQASLDHIKKVGGEEAFINQLIGDDKDIAQLRENLKQAEQDLEIFNIQQDKLKKDAIKQAADDKKKANEKELADQKKHDEELLKEQKRLADEMQKARLDAIAKEEEVTDAYRVRQLNDQQKEIDDLTNRLYKELEMAGDNNELKLLLEEEYQKNVQDIADKYAKEQADKEEQERKDEFNKRLENTEKLVGSLSGLNQSLMEAELNMAGDNEEKKQEIRKKAFRRQKALDLADATIQGIKAVQSALASPFPFNIALAAINGATAAANIAKIASVKFEGETGGGSAGGGLANTGRATQGANVPQVTNTTTTIGEPTKVFVTEQDISNTQNKVKVAESQSTL